MLECTVQKFVDASLSGAVSGWRSVWQGGSCFGGAVEGMGRKPLQKWLIRRLHNEIKIANKLKVSDSGLLLQGAVEGTGRESLQTVET